MSPIMKGYLSAVKLEKTKVAGPNTCNIPTSNLLTQVRGRNGSVITQAVPYLEAGSRSGDNNLDILGLLIQTESFPLRILRKHPRGWGKFRSMMDITSLSTDRNPNTFSRSTILVAEYVSDQFYLIFTSRNVQKAHIN